MPSHEIEACFVFLTLHEFCNIGKSQTSPEVFEIGSRNFDLNDVIITVTSYVAHCKMNTIFEFSGLLAFHKPVQVKKIDISIFE